MAFDHNRLNRFLLYFLIVVTPLIFTTSLTRNPFAIQIYVFQMGLGLCVARLLWSFCRPPFYSLSFSPLDLPLICFLSVMVMSFWVGFFRYPSLRIALFSEGMKGGFFFLSTFVGIYWIRMQVQDPQYLQRIRTGIYWVATVASVYALAQYFGMEWIWSGQLNAFGHRPVSTFGNPNFLSSYLVLVLPVVFVDWLRPTPTSARWILCLHLFVQFSALLATLTRSSWGGLFVAVVYLSLTILPQLDRQRLTKVAIWFLPIGLMLIFLWPTSQEGRYGQGVIERLTETTQLFHSAYGAWSQRQLIWSCAWEMFCDHWIVGIGWGCFELFYPFYQSAYLVDPVWAPFRTHANNAHQIILECVSQAGVIGFGILMWGVVLWIKLTREQLKHEDSPERFMRHGIIAALLGVVADNFLNVSFFFTAPAILITWWAADCIQKSSFTVRFEGSSKRQWFLVGLGFFSSFMMILHAFCLWMGEIKHFQGFSRSRGGVDLWQGVKDFESANRWYPWDVQTHYELANLQGRLGNFEQAIHSYDRALLSNPGYDEIYFNRGTLLAQQGRWAESLESFEKSHLIHPQFVPAQQAIAVIKARLTAQANLLK